MGDNNDHHRNNSVASRLRKERLGHALLGWSREREIVQQTSTCVCYEISYRWERWWWLFIVLVAEVRQTKSCYLRPSTTSWRKYFIIILVICCIKNIAAQTKVVSDNRFSCSGYVWHDTIKSPHKITIISKHYNRCTWQDCSQEWAQKLCKHA